MSTKTIQSSHLIAQNPLLLRCHRLTEAFAKSDDERDFYLDMKEGFLVYVDLDKPHLELAALEKELKKEPDRYCLIPKLTFYETKKIMEGFVNEKVYDIDTKEKLLDIIGSKSARENFLEFLYDHHAEQEKWQQYYQERSRIRIIEWLRRNHVQFVFEEDLDLPRPLLEKIKTNLFQKKVSKDIEAARRTLLAKAKVYYSNEALNPRPKRGRPPKQVAKPEVEHQVSTDIYTMVPPAVRPFLFTPEIGQSWLATFSSKFETEEQLLASRKSGSHFESNLSLENLNKKLESLRQISNRLVEKGLMKREELSGSIVPSQRVSREDEDGILPDQSRRKGSEGEHDREAVPVLRTAVKGPMKAVAKTSSKPAAIKKPMKKKPEIKKKQAKAPARRQRRVK